MATTKDSAPAHPSTRELRGLRLHQEHADEIERILPHTYSVPSCSGETTYTVRLAPRVHCDCPDFERRGEPCKHVFAATVAASKIRGRRRSA